MDSPLERDVKMDMFLAAPHPVAGILFTANQVEDVVVDRHGGVFAAAIDGDVWYIEPTEACPENSIREATKRLVLPTNNAERRSLDYDSRADCCVITEASQEVDRLGMLTREGKYMVLHDKAVVDYKTHRYYADDYEHKMLQSGLKLRVYNETPFSVVTEVLDAAGVVGRRFQVPDLPPGTMDPTCGFRASGIFLAGNNLCITYCRHAGTMVDEDKGYVQILRALK